MHRQVKYILFGIQLFRIFFLEEQGSKFLENWRTSNNTNLWMWAIELEGIFWNVFSHIDKYNELSTYMFQKVCHFGLCFTFYMGQ